ncbi:MAG: rubrerythrin family protein [Candidatus Lokiarchaeota archaeon]|nr:rubrerythrin family protein [Candidatus Lokiarchaeota archaeon]MBD3342209.1 rubrerythrin family protein [Candidatus Lokiarchaeota archaeon]
MTKTKENLKAAFAGESQANRKYLAFAEKADKDGYPQVARVFRAAATAETVHAHNHLRVMGGINSTIENLKEAVEGEHYEFTDMYPDFIKDAKAEGNKKAEQTFDYANQVEKVHHTLYEKALDSVKSGKDLKEKEIYVCPICGYTHEGTPPDKCPVCGAAKKVFKKID